MKIALVFHANGKADISLTADTPAERAILAFMAEGEGKRWQSAVRHPYLAGGIEHTLLVEVPTEDK